MVNLPDYPTYGPPAKVKFTDQERIKVIAFCRRYLHGAEVSLAKLRYAHKRFPNDGWNKQIVHEESKIGVLRQMISNLGGGLPGKKDRSRRGVSDADVSPSNTGGDQVCTRPTKKGDNSGAS